MKPNSRDTDHPYEERNIVNLEAAVSQLMSGWSP